LSVIGVVGYFEFKYLTFFLYKQMYRYQSTNSSRFERMEVSPIHTIIVEVDIANLDLRKSRYNYRNLR